MSERHLVIDGDLKRAVFIVIDGDLFGFKFGAWNDINQAEQSGLPEVRWSVLGIVRRRGYIEIPRGLSLPFAIGSELLQRYDRQHSCPRCGRTDEASRLKRKLILRQAAALAGL